MKILRKYVLKELIGPGILSLVVFTFLVLANKLFRLTDLLVSHGVKAKFIFQLLLCLLPTLFSLTIPMALLAAVLIGLGRLSAGNEILAIRTAGVNLMRLFIPIIIVALVVSGAMLVANLSLIPQLMLKVTDLIYQVEFQVLSSLEPGRFYDDLGGGAFNLTLYFKEKGDSREELRDISIKITAKRKRRSREANGETEEERNNIMLVASRGKIKAQPEEKSIKIKLNDGLLFPLEIDETGKDYLIHFKELSRVITPRLGKIKHGKYVKRPREMSYQELYAALSNPENDPEDIWRIKKDLYQRFSSPLSSLAFVLIGIPLAIYIRPSGKSVGFALSFGLLLIYYFLLKWGTTLGEEGVSWAPLAIFSPNILLGLIGLVLIYKVVRK